jgi:hypothetical protein
MIARFLATSLIIALPTLAIGQASPVDNYAPRKVLLVPMRAITNPKIVAANEAQVAENDLVIGVEIGGQARAYPINQLTGPSREIINDVLAGTAIAATW